MDCKTMEQLADAGKYDLLISNYAFSELSRPIQQIYIDKILRKSKRGFMLVNNMTDQFAIDQFSYAEIMSALPAPSQILADPVCPEIQTNRLILWGHK